MTATLPIAWPEINVSVIKCHKPLKISQYQSLGGSPAAHAYKTQAPSLPSPEHLDAAQEQSNGLRFYPSQRLTK
jgi:hypothetical protein